MQCLDCGRNVKPHAIKCVCGWETTDPKSAGSFPLFGSQETERGKALAILGGLKAKLAQNRKPLSKSVDNWRKDFEQSEQA